MLKQQLESLYNQIDELHAVIYPNKLYNEEAHNQAKQDGTLKRYHELQAQAESLRKHIIQVDFTENILNPRIATFSPVSRAEFLRRIAKVKHAIVFNNGEKSIANGGNRYNFTVKSTHFLSYLDENNTDASYFYFDKSNKYLANDTTLAVYSIEYNRLLEYKIVTQS